jgi:hypothetical protein
VKGASFFYCSAILNIFWVEKPMEEKSCVFNGIILTIGSSNILIMMQWPPSLPENDKPQTWFWCTT